MPSKLEADKTIEATMSQRNTEEADCPKTIISYG
jgi:hypothetical protein